MMCRKTEDASGEYTDKSGKRYILEICRRVRPSAGWTEFDSPEQCLLAWGLAYCPLADE